MKDYTNKKNELTKELTELNKCQLKFTNYEMEKLLGGKSNEIFNESEKTRK